MARGLKKHLKRLNAPKHWMLDKPGGAFMLCKSPRQMKASDSSIMQRGASVSTLSGMRKQSLSFAKSDLSNLGRRASRTSTPMMVVLSTNQSLLSRLMTPSSSI